jgi:hypothetical protein
MDNWKGGGGYDFAVMEGGGGSKGGCFAGFVAIMLVPTVIIALSFVL